MRRRSRAAGAIGAGVGLAAALELLVPRRPLPTPTGPHPVGTTAVELAPPAATHPTTGPAPRSLPVQIWYPAAGRDGRPARLFPAGRRIGPAMAASFPPPAPVFALLSRARGHARLDATSRWTEAAGCPPPRGVVVVVHGWLGFRAIHADLAEQLASDGWVVLAADHVGGAVVAQHLDGDVTALQPDLMPTEGDPDYWDRATALVDRYVHDVRRVLEAVRGAALAPVVPAGPATTLLVGQSTGGGAAVAVAATDDRVDGVVGLDPWVAPVREAVRAALDVPFVAIRSTPWVGNRNDHLLADVRVTAFREVVGAGHTDLTGLGWLSPALRLAGLTSVSPRAQLVAATEAVDLVLATDRPTPEHP